MSKKETTPTSSKRMRKKELQEKIMSFLDKEKKQSFNYKQISHAIGAEHPANRLDVINLLDELTAADEILEVSSHMRFSEREAVFSNTSIECAK